MSDVLNLLCDYAAAGAVVDRSLIAKVESEIARLTERLAAAEADNERLERWRKLAIAAATAGADKEVFRRFAESEAIQPIIQVWRDNAKTLEAKLAAAEALLREAVECGEWFDGTFHIEMNADWLDKAKEVCDEPL